MQISTYRPRADNSGSESRSGWPPTHLTIAEQLLKPPYPTQHQYFRWVETDHYGRTSWWQNFAAGFPDAADVCFEATGQAWFVQRSTAARGTVCCVPLLDGLPGCISAVACSGDICWGCAGRNRWLAVDAIRGCAESAASRLYHRIASFVGETDTDLEEPQ